MMASEPQMMRPARRMMQAAQRLTRACTPDDFQAQLRFTSRSNNRCQETAKNFMPGRDFFQLFRVALKLTRHSSHETLLIGPSAWRKELEGEALYWREKLQRQRQSLHNTLHT
jgi:hypothetical protein